MTFRCTSTPSSQTEAALVLVRFLVAVPVGARETCERLASLADAVVCVSMPEPLNAVGLWYEDFSQTSDREVCDLLERGLTAQSHRQLALYATDLAGALRDVDARYGVVVDPHTADGLKVAIELRDPAVPRWRALLANPVAEQSRL